MKKKMRYVIGGNELEHGKEIFRVVIDMRLNKEEFKEFLDKSSANEIEVQI